MEKTTYDIYRLMTIGTCTTADKCLGHELTEEQVNEWRNAHPEYKGHIIVCRNWA